jgi:multiple sugar transport system permease protein
MLSVGLLDFIFTFQVFPLIWMTTGGGPGYSTEVLSTFTYKIAFGQFQFSLASTSALILLIVSMILAYFYVKKQKITE